MASSEQHTLGESKKQGGGGEGGGDGGDEGGDGGGDGGEGKEKVGFQCEGTYKYRYRYC